MLCMLACVSLTPHSTMHHIAHPLPCAHRTPPMRAAVRPIPLLSLPLLTMADFIPAFTMDDSYPCPNPWM